LAQTFAPFELELLLNQTAKLRRDPAEVKAEIDRADNAAWIDKNLDSAFAIELPDGTTETFSISEFL
jgi:hypothetical protein